MLIWDNTIGINTTGSGNWGGVSNSGAYGGMDAGIERHMDVLEASPEIDTPPQFARIIYTI